MPVMQRADPMHLECVFLGDLTTDVSYLGSSLFSTFQEEAFATAFSIRGRAASAAKETYEEDMDIHGCHLGWTHVGLYEFFSCRDQWRPSLVE